MYVYIYIYTGRDFLSCSRPHSPLQQIPSTPSRKAILVMKASDFALAPMFHVPQPVCRYRERTPRSKTPAKALKVTHNPKP